MKRWVIDRCLDILIIVAGIILADVIQKGCQWTY
jgi:hypothetical protein